MDSASKSLFLAKMKKFNVDVFCDKAFCKLTTFGCGGTINITVYPSSVKQLQATLRWVTKLNLPFVVLGKGSNVIAGEDYYDGVVIATAKLNKITVRHNKVTALCGTSTAKLSQVLTKNGLDGGEFFACLPASVGGATVCNAGCYGQNVSQVVDKVTVWHNGKLCRLSKSQCQFGKRTSVFKNNPEYVVVGVQMHFAVGTASQVQCVVDNFRHCKSTSQPLGERSAGCVLYHDKVAVSALLDKCGLKGLCIGGAQVSTKHAGFVINVNKATAQDVYLLIQREKDILHKRFGINAKTEVCFVNFKGEQ